MSPSCPLANRVTSCPSCTRLHTDERRPVPFRHIAGVARSPSTELSEQSSSWGSCAEEANFTARRRKCRSLPVCSQSSRHGSRRSQAGGRADWPELGSETAAGEFGGPFLACPSRLPRSKDAQVEVLLRCGQVPSSQSPRRSRLDLGCPRSIDPGRGLAPERRSSNPARSSSNWRALDLSQWRTRAATLGNYSCDGYGYDLMAKRARHSLAHRRNGFSPVAPQR